jgi:hypothetical protein
MSIFSDRDEVKQLKRIAAALEELVRLERDELRDSVVDFTLSQLRGDTFMSIAGVVVGATGTFQISFVPATNFIPLPSPPTVSVDDTNVTLSAVDPTAFTFSATVSSTDTGASFNITVAGVNDKGASLSHVFNIPILPAPPPPPTSVTDFGLDQTS